MTALAVVLVSGASCAIVLVRMLVIAAVTVHRARVVIVRHADPGHDSTNRLNGNGDSQDDK